MSVKYRRLYTSVGQCYDFNGLSSQAVLLYLLLISKADIDGKMLAIPEFIKASCALFINDIKEKDINSILKQLADKGLIIVYQWDDKPILMIKNFREKQEVRKNYEAESKYPDPDGSNSITLENTPKNSKVIKSNSELNSDFEECYSAYPRKEGKAIAFKHWKAHPRSKEDMLRAISNYEKEMVRRYPESSDRKKFTQTAGRFFFESWQDWVETEDDRKRKAEEARQRKLIEAEEAARAKFLAENPDIKAKLEGK